MTRTGSPASGKKERELYANYPLRRSLRTLKQVIGANLQAHILTANAERFAHVGAHWDHPGVSLVGRPVISHLRIAVDIPSALEVIGDLRLRCRSG